MQNKDALLKRITLDTGTKSDFLQMRLKLLLSLLHWLYGSVGVHDDRLKTWCLLAVFVSATGWFYILTSQKYLGAKVRRIRAGCRLWPAGNMGDQLHGNSRGLTALCQYGQHDRCLARAKRQVSAGVHLWFV